MYIVRVYVHETFGVISVRWLTAMISSTPTKKSWRPSSAVVINGDERVTRVVAKGEVLVGPLLLWPRGPNTSLTDGSVPARHKTQSTDHGFHPIEGLEHCSLSPWRRSRRAGPVR